MAFTNRPEFPEISRQNFRNPHLRVPEILAGVLPEILAGLKKEGRSEGGMAVQQRRPPSRGRCLGWYERGRWGRGPHADVVEPASGPDPARRRPRPDRGRAPRRGRYLQPHVLVIDEVGYVSVRVSVATNIPLSSRSGNVNCAALSARRAVPMEAAKRSGLQGQSAHPLRLARILIAAGVASTATVHKALTSSSSRRPPHFARTWSKSIRAGRQASRRVRARLHFHGRLLRSAISLYLARGVQHDGCQM